MYEKFKAASYFRKKTPIFIPESIWHKLSRFFYSNDIDGVESLNDPPSWMPYRMWRLMSKAFFRIDIFKHRDFHKFAPETLREAMFIAPDSWLIFGSLLGFARDGRLIPWDRDLDLGCMSDSMTEKLVDRFLSRGFKIERLYRYEGSACRNLPSESQGKISKVVFRKGAKLEFFCFIRGNDGRLYYTEGRNKLFAIDYGLNFPQVDSVFCGVGVKVPERTVDNLNYMYGEDWLTPKPEYINSKEHKSRQNIFYV